MRLRLTLISQWFTANFRIHKNKRTAGKSTAFLFVRPFKTFTIGLIKLPAGCSILRDWEGPYFRSFRHSHDSVAAHVSYYLCRAKPHRDFRGVQTRGVSAIRVTAVPYQEVERPSGIVFGRKHDWRTSG